MAAIEQADPSPDLAAGRTAAQEHAWADCYALLSRAAEAGPLRPDDLSLLATAAYLRGELPVCVDALRQAYEWEVREQHPRQAARAAFWASFALGNQREIGQASGWLARAESLLAAEPADCAERGLVLAAYAFRSNTAGDFEQGAAFARQAMEIGRRTGDPDVHGLALTQCGGALVKLGQAAEAVPVLDEAMLAVVSREISPIAAGTVYCVVISIFSEMAEIRRAQEWTDALTGWLDQQHNLIVFSGRCLVHRAELRQLHGDWPGAVEEAERACDRLSRSPEVASSGGARYQQAEVLRRWGNYAAAEQAYRAAGEWGHELCPGLALLRLAQGDPAAARSALRRALGETTDRLRRIRLLPAQVEVELAADDVASAVAAATELAAIADQFAAPALRAQAHHARGAVLLAEENPAAALSELRSAARLWRDLDVPYEGARARVLIALACRALGDEDTAALELAAADAVFAQLGARPDRARVAGLGRVPVPPSHGLTARELQVLRLVATGRTNSAIARELSLSEKTVERHLSNVFTKIGVSSRAAATAYAFQQRLIDP
ncbi:response regulator transcription factor [Hamadaea sp. NPDC051192]|uniref:response regulator transcription factor n=1 Tax=Hamadaea sp. NPDC051192 TaxID=3154940 RepID=UPI003424E0A2